MLLRYLIVFAGFILAAPAFAQDFWIPLGGPADPEILSSPQPFYARHLKMLFTYAGDSLYRSDDNGDTWYKISTQLKSVRGMVETPTKKLFACGSNNLILMSSNAGETWAEVLPMTGQFVGNLFVSPKGHIYATIMQGGLWRSTDDGITWGPCNNGLPVKHWGEGVAFLSNGEMLVSTGLDGIYGIYRSSDDGNSWARSDSGISHTFVWWLCEAKPGLIIAGTNFAGIYRSTDNGYSWHSSPAGVSDSTKSEVFHVFADGAGTIYADCSYRGGLYRSTDDGLSWQSIQSGLKYKSPGLIAIDGDGYMYYGGRDRVYRAREKVTPPKANVTANHIPGLRLAMSPNPASTYISVSGLEACEVYKIYDQLGRVIESFTSEGEMLNIPLQNMSSGIYTVRSDSTAVRFVKW